MTANSAPRPPATMVLGTHSNAGKSIIAAGLCRLLARRGYNVAPFKAQNMSNNAGVTADGGEMGRAQLVQAEAAGVEPHTDMNPVLLKPEADRRSQVVLDGRVHGHIDSANWRDLKQTLWRHVCAAYDRLAARYDVIILEGAGSPAEINLKDADMVNLAMARHAEAPCLLVGDIDRGGVFAALAGTMLLLDPEERSQVRGLLINKFRGDPVLLGDAVDRLRELAFDTPCLGVVPFLPYLGIAEEDAVSFAGSDSAEISCDVAVVQLPHIANFDDFDPIVREPGVRLRWVRHPRQVGRPAAILLPGTKATLSDLDWLRTMGWDRAIEDAVRQGTRVAGVCGGFQMLGTLIRDPDGVEAAAGSSRPGLGLLPVETGFCQDKQTSQAVLVTAGDSGDCIEGYEIHAGETTRGQQTSPFGHIVSRSGNAVDVADGAVGHDGAVWGTYLHGLFHHEGFRRRWLTELGWRLTHQAPCLTPDSEYDRVADALEDAVGWQAWERFLFPPG
ncbi:MAG TPA: cobyric acid synthase [Candidatus Latescibacteria bacterium]|nr:cobyric acid synthase [Candidatus Latescibacterota bacterium]